MHQITLTKIPFVVLLLLIIPCNHYRYYASGLLFLHHILNSTDIMHRLPPTYNPIPILCIGLFYDLPHITNYRYYASAYWLIISNLTIQFGFL